MIGSVKELNVCLVGVFIFQAPVQALLPQLESSDAGKICVVIDLDETLVHSSFKASWQCCPLSESDCTGQTDYYCYYYKKVFPLKGVKIGKCNCGSSLVQELNH